MSPSSTSIEAKYWLTRVLMDAHEPISTSTEVSVVSTISATEIPSAPRWYWMSNAGIHSRRSRNCKPGAAKSNPVSSRRLTRKITTAEPSATQRAAFGRALPHAKVNRPPRMGSQIRRLRRGQFDTYLFPSAPVADEHGQQQHQADDHHECVVVEEARLGTARHGGHQAHHAHRAVHDQAIDDLLVEPAGDPAQPEAAAGEALDPEIVGPVLVLEHLDRQAQRLPGAGRQLRPPPVHRGGQ